MNWNVGDWRIMLSGFVAEAREDRWCFRCNLNAIIDYLVYGLTGHGLDYSRAECGGYIPIVRLTDTDAKQKLYTAGRVPVWMSFYVAVGIRRKAIR